MTARKAASGWSKLLQRRLTTWTRLTRTLGKAALYAPARRSLPKPPAKKPARWSQGSAVGLTGMRRYRLYTPAGVRPSDKLALMVMLHGCTQDAQEFADSTGMNKLAAREKFLVLYPEQDRLANPQRCWNWYDTAAGRAQSEAELIMRAIDQVCLFHPIDQQRVAVAGLSAGASMAALLATRHPDRFQAIVMHSGIPPGTARSGVSALGAMRGRRATRPLPPQAATASGSWPPLLVIHGTLDAIVSSSNGEAAVHIWAQAAGARPGPARTVQRGQRYPMSITDYKRKRQTVCSMIQVSRLGHAWSGGAPGHQFSDPRAPDASRMAWAFAKKHFSARDQ